MNPPDPQPTHAEIQANIVALMRFRERNGGRHLHHRDCIHNLTPGEQVRVRGKSIEWWKRLVGELPEQIAPDQWETEPPVWPSDREASS